MRFNNKQYEFFYIIRSGIYYERLERIKKILYKNLNKVLIDNHIQIKLIDNLDVNSLVEYFKYKDFTIFVYVGLLVYIHDDNIAIALICHEISHVLNKDYEKISNVLKGKYNLDNKECRINLEHYADMKALELLKELNISPYCLIRFFEEVDKLDDSNPYQYIPIEYETNTHYSLYRRIQNVLTFLGDY